MKTKRLQNFKAQVTLEFTFCFLIVLLIFYGCLKAFEWVGVDLAKRRIAHDETFNIKVEEDWTDLSNSSLIQLDPDFYTSSKMNMVFNGW